MAKNTFSHMALRCAAGPQDIDILSSSIVYLIFLLSLIDTSGRIFIFMRLASQVYSIGNVVIIAGGFQ